MRALIVCYAYPPEPAPGGVMAQELAEDLAGQGHEVTVITGFPNHPEGVLYPGWRRRMLAVQRQGAMRVARTWHLVSRSRRTVPRALFYLSFAVTSLVNALRLGPCDVVYCDSTPIFGAVSCWLIAVLKRTALIYAIFDMYPEAIVQAGLMSPGLLARALQWLDCFVCRRADRVVVIAEGFRERLLERGLSESRIAVLPMWVDRDEVHPLPRVNPWRTEKGIPNEAFVVLYAGTIGLVSGAQILTEVAEQCADEPAILFLMVGQGLAKDEAQRLAQEKALANMRFLDFQPRERLAEVQASADVSVVTLLPGKGRNSVPSKVLAYMAAGRPIIASVDADSDTARWITEAACGIVTPPQDAGALAEAVQFIRDNPDYARDMSERGREFFLARHSRTAATSAYQALFERVVAEQRSRGSTQTTGGPP
ncbi:MAG: glycosyltransferase family 4 protein [Armatimonadetes bacterium]|nr:glycosyltransferase family 4 protein [Armatimonadota bacterium]